MVTHGKEVDQFHAETKISLCALLQVSNAHVARMGLFYACYTSPMCATLTFSTLHRPLARYLVCCKRLLRMS